MHLWKPKQSRTDAKAAGTTAWKQPDPAVESGEAA